MIGVELGGLVPKQVGDVGGALALHPQLDVVMGVSPSRFDHTLRQVIAVRAKDPLKPWESDPEWVAPFVRPFTEAVAGHGRVAGRKRLWVDVRLHKPPELRPELGLVFVGGAPPPHGHGFSLPAEPDAFEAQVDGLLAYLGVDDNPVVRRALRVLPRDADSATAESDDVARSTIRALDADEHVGSVDLASARAHPNPRVRAAATRWLVRRGLEPEAAELLCGTRLILWHALGPPA